MSTARDNPRKYGTSTLREMPIHPNFHENVRDIPSGGGFSHASQDLLDLLFM